MLFLDFVRELAVLCMDTFLTSLVYATLDYCNFKFFWSDLVGLTVLDRMIFKNQWHNFKSIYYDQSHVLQSFIFVHF